VQILLDFIYRGVSIVPLSEVGPVIGLANALGLRGISNGMRSAVERPRVAASRSTEKDAPLMKRSNMSQFVRSKVKTYGQRVKATLSYF